MKDTGHGKVKAERAPGRKILLSVSLSFAVRGGERGGEGEGQLTRGCAAATTILYNSKRMLHPRRKSTANEVQDGFAFLDAGKGRK